MDHKEKATESTYSISGIQRVSAENSAEEHTRAMLRDHSLHT